MRHILIDTDAGVDDTLALIYASRSSDVNVELLTTVSGNVPVKEVTQNVLYLKELLHWDIEVCSGADVPRSRKLVTAPEVHGDDGVGNYRKTHGITFDDWETGDAAPRLVAAAKKFRKNLTIVSLGPMTNIADAVAIDAEAMMGAGRIVQMGGVFSGYGNTGVHSEFNIFVDPEATDFVLNNGIKIDFVPLDLTELLSMPRRLFESLTLSPRHDDAEITRLLRKAVRFYADYHRATDRLDGCFLHDPITVAAAISPHWFQFVGSSIDVETSGAYTSGVTVANLRKRARSGNSRIAVSFDATSLMKDFAMKVFRRKVSAATVRSECLRERFVPSFSGNL